MAWIKIVKKVNRRIKFEKGKYKQKHRKIDTNYLKLKNIHGK